MAHDRQFTYLYCTVLPPVVGGCTPVSTCTEVMFVKRQMDFQDVAFLFSQAILQILFN